jgi:hypothetical protein
MGRFQYRAITLRSMLFVVVRGSRIHPAGEHIDRVVRRWDALAPQEGVQANRMDPVSCTGLWGHVESLEAEAEAVRAALSKRLLLIAEARHDP